MILHTTDVSETGLYFDQVERFPFLKTGMTMADFESNRIVPLSIEIWKRWARPGANSSAMLFCLLLGPPGLN